MNRGHHRVIEHVALYSQPALQWRFFWSVISISMCQRLAVVPHSMMILKMYKNRIYCYMLLFKLENRLQILLYLWSWTSNLLPVELWLFFVAVSASIIVPKWTRVRLTWSHLSEEILGFRSVWCMREQGERDLYVDLNHCWFVTVLR